MTKFKSVSSLGDTGTIMDLMHDELCDYQTLADDEVSQKAWSEAKVVDGSLGGEDSITG